jgi:hypothetical protein
VSAPLLKYFLRSCETEHGDACNTSSQHLNNGNPISMLLIDVLEQRLVPFDLGSNCRYIALSYVWGKVKMLQTTKDNLSTLMEEGSLIKVRDQLPRVVQDSMAVVSMIGERYLWVDAISILQDDTASKRRQIMHMDLIYKNSTLAIVAMSTTHANDRLMGIPPSPRPVTAAYLQGFTLARETATLGKALKDTVYETRAWTLQEKILSNRCLFISPELVYFQCHVTSSRETANIAAIESSSLRQVPSTDLGKQRKLISAAMDSQETFHWHCHFFSGKTYFHGWSYLVEDYTSRSLSYPSDTLLGISGIQAMLSTAAGGDCVSGLPEEVFDASLFWIPSRHGAFKRRTHIVSSPDSSSFYAPSWSWIGWEGRVESALPGKLHINNISSIVRSFQVFGPDAGRAVRRHSDKLKEYPVQDEDEELRTIGEACIASSPFQTSFLVFRTEVMPLASFLPLDLMMEGVSAQ